MEMLGLFNYWIVIVLMMVGFYIVMAQPNMVKKIFGLNIFQVSVFVLYITMGKVEGGTAPILSPDFTVYTNPIPSVLILTAIVVGVATMAVGLALIVRIRQAFGSIEDDDIARIEAGMAMAGDDAAPMAGGDAAPTAAGATVAR